MTWWIPAIAITVVVGSLYTALAITRLVARRRQKRPGVYGKDWP